MYSHTIYKLENLTLSSIMFVNRYHTVLDSHLPSYNREQVIDIHLNFHTFKSEKYAISSRKNEFGTIKFYEYSRLSFYQYPLYISLH